MTEPIIGIDASRSYIEPMTGTERYSRRIVEHLIRIAPDELGMRLFFRDAPPADAPIDHAERRVLPARRLWTHHRLRRELSQHPVDLLFVPSHVLPIGYRGPSVVTIHDLGYLHEPSSHTLSSRAQLDLTTRWNARQATQIIAISNATRRDLIEQYGTDPERISVIHLGIDPQFAPGSADITAQLRRDRKLPDRFILYLGTIHPRKNIDRLIGAFEEIAIHDSEIELVIAGSRGWKSDPILSRARSSSVSKRIRLEGRIPERELPAMYGAAAAVAFPSLYEGFGLPALEAMACGTPIVMSNRGALPEICGADARIVDPLNIEDMAGALRLALDSSADHTLRQARITHAQRFTWERTARATLDVLSNAVNL